MPNSIGRAKNVLALLLVLGAMLPAHAQPPVGAGYELLFSEEFDGDKVNTAHWRFREDRRTDSYMNGLNRRQNVAVAGGSLLITARQEMIDGKPENTGGGLISKHQFGYGYYETLSKPFMAGRGVHSAFWQRGGSIPNNTIFEIDSYEIDSGSWMGCNNLYLQLGTKAQSVPWPHRAHVPFALRPDGWFLDAYEYTPEGVIFYDNGKVVAKAEWKELTAAQCVWLTALNGVGKVDTAKQPGVTEFAYFRYYAKDYPGVNLLPNGSFEYNQDRGDQPIAWQQDGTPGAGKVIAGEAARDRYKLRHASPGGAYHIMTHQSLEFIRNGEYQLTARVRSSGGQKTARLVVRGYGGPELVLTIPVAVGWTKIALPKIPVSNHGVTIAIESMGEAGQWLECDDIQFLKPGKAAPSAEPFSLRLEPPWQLAQREPIAFTGDNKFYFFDRSVGRGAAISVDLTMNPAKRQDAALLARQPKTGTAGWSVLLTQQGQVVFRIGSGASHQDVVADVGYAVGKETRVVCVFDRGTATISLDGKQVAQATGIACTTDDATAAGRLGAVNDIYDAVSDVIAPGTPSAAPRKYKNYVGTLRAVTVDNAVPGQTRRAN
jgi:hypothetical protein